MNREANRYVIDVYAAPDFRQQLIARYDALAIADQVDENFERPRLNGDALARSE
jgi:hypothetical protein